MWRPLEVPCVAAKVPKKGPWNRPGSRPRMWARKRRFSSRNKEEQTKLRELKSMLPGKGCWLRVKLRNLATSKLFLVSGLTVTLFHSYLNIWISCPLYHL